MSSRTSEGLDRRLVVDIAIGVGHTDDDDILDVTQFIYIRSLDGVDWNDHEKKKQLYVGKAIQDFFERTRGRSELEPIMKENIPRVTSSAALKMFDHNYIAVPQYLASENTPIVINNACASWHRLAETFTFGNARAYIGTLYPVTTSEAEAITVSLLDKQFGKPLPTALWGAQRRAYGTSVRRPYVITGVYPQRLRAVQRDVPRDVVAKLVNSLIAWRKKLKNLSTVDADKEKRLKEHVEYYEREIELFAKRWPHSIRGIAR